MEATGKLVGKKVLVRSDKAGVFFGTLNEAETADNTLIVELLDVRRLWQWSGACSLTQMAMEGTKNPAECKFTMTEDSIVVASVVEIHECTAEAVTSIESVPDWKL